MKGRQINYSDEERAWIKACCDLPRTELHALFVQVFNRPDVTKTHIKALCSRNRWNTGRSGCFVKGQTPVNKGQKMAYHPNSAATRFKKGNLPHNTRFIGHERLSKDGYVEISVAEVNPHTGADRRYVLKHRHLWVQANGPIPEGHRLKCLDGDKTNTDPSNWECVPTGLVPRLSGKYGRGYDAAPAEIKPTIMAISKLEHAARNAGKGATNG